MTKSSGPLGPRPEGSKSSGIPTGGRPWGAGPKTPKASRHWKGAMTI